MRSAVQAPGQGLPGLGGPGRLNMSRGYLCCAVLGHSDVSDSM